MRRSLLLLASSLTLFARVASAQTPPDTVTLPAPVVLPPAPTINDPMLAPMPPPQRAIATWQETLDLIRNRSTDLRTAYDEVLRAQGQVRTALAAMLPTINGTGTYAHQLAASNGLNASEIKDLGPLGPLAGIAPDNEIILGAQAIQPIVALGAWQNYRTTKVAVDAAKLSFEDMKRTIALAVAGDLIAVITAERVAELNRIGTRSALERLDLARRKNALGASSRLDVIRAQQDVENSRAALVTGDESLREAREALGLALGLPMQVGVAKNLNLDGLVKDALDTCKVAASVEDRADVAAARTRLLAAKRNVDGVYYQFAPTLNAQSNASYDVTIPSGGSSAITSWNIEAVLSVPLWDGGVRYGSLRQTRALEDEALQTLESTRRQAVVQVEQARRSVAVAENAELVAKNVDVLAAENDRLTRVGYIEGQGTSLELVTAASALREADITLALRQFDLVKARVTAILALANCPW
jgi:multidrug efflux system outer membrane protein